VVCFPYSSVSTLTVGDYHSRGSSIYFAKASFKIISEKEDTIHSNNEYLRENLKRQFRAIEVYCRFLFDPDYDRDK
jgi:IS1 family transposase